MTELRRCPFCGGEARISELTYPMKHYTVICSNEKCYAQMGDFLSNEDAIEAWNTRPNPWQTGTPTEKGVYLCASENEFRKYGLAYWDGEGFHSKQVGMIVKWQKIEEKN